jgi:hypothetical protein
MLRRVVVVITDVSEELSASIIRVTRIGELGTTWQNHDHRRQVENGNAFLVIFLFWGGEVRKAGKGGLNPSGTSLLSGNILRPGVMQQLASKLPRKFTGKLYTEICGLHWIRSLSGNGRGVAVDLVIHGYWKEMT